MIKKCFTIISSLVFTATTGIICPFNTKAIEDIEPVEVVSMRSEYEKHYDNGDGTYTAYIDTVPLHYYENGEWLDIDNTLMQDENGNYVNRSNSMKVTLSLETSVSPINAINGASNDNNQMVSVDYNGYSLSWSLIDTEIADDKPVIKDEPIVMSENVTDIEAKNPEIVDTQADVSENIIDSAVSYEKVYPVSEASINEQESVERDIGMNKLNTKISESVSNLNSSVSYNNICEAVDCKVDIQSNSVKETLILENPDNLLEEYSYFIQSDGLVAELYEDNSVVFSDGDENVFIIPAPFMFDSSEYSDNNYDIKVTLEEYDNGYIYTLSPDIEWLTDESRIYPVMIDPTVKASYNKLSFSYNSEATPYVSYTSDYFYVGNESKNSYHAFSTFDNSFDWFGNNPTVLGAYMYVTPISSNLNNSMTITVNPITARVESISWKSSSNGNWLRNINNDNVNFTVSPHSTDRCSVNITNFVQYAVNNAYTNNDGIGYELHGFKFSPSSYSNRGTVKFCNDSGSDNRPFYTISYTDSTNYTLPYAPEKYDNNSKVTYSSNTYVFNFQNRMNCYAYALQVYCNEKQIPYMTYKSYPGEFGISSGKTTDKYKINKFLDLKTFYTSFTDRYSVEGLTGMAKQIILKEYSDFVEEQMYRDARALNFSINKYSNSSVIKNNKFTLPTSFDENKGRIIAMVNYEVSSGDLDSHFYLRNGNGTCPNGHAGTCSMWSHKPGTSPVTNCPTTNYTVKLCDANIQEYAYKSRNMSEEIKTDVKYFNITKDTNIYTSAHDNGQYDDCTGTPYYGN